MYGSWSKTHPGYRFSVLGYSSSTASGPIKIVSTRTLDGAELVEERLRNQGLFTEIVPYGESSGPNHFHENGL